NTAKETYEHNNRVDGKPIPYLNEDIRKLDGRAISRFLSPGAITLFAGCPPCQPFSRMRTDKTKSVRDQDLLLEFGRVIEQCRPDFVLVENVRGMKEHSDVFMGFVNQLETIGYRVKYADVNAADYGVPQ